MSKVPSKETIKRRTVSDMKALGVHKPQYNRLIDAYSDIVHQYLTLTERFEKEGYEYESYTAAGGAKKSPIVATLESLRKDILAYSDRLCLNPKSNDPNNKAPTKNTGLVEALNSLGG
ncbi:P27 family phage terminase small subunit [Lysinibacillus capsici]|uniref:P27 family phage terminase small subunit n=1 Tax=Lysinibacillus capsici TaxID=2115968 RepID=UPI000E20227C|nr:P27 family phage terminase small subunit [Lysinibacillus capsici]RDV26302.1 terminase [Lysinibacillus capsici]